MTVIAYRDGIMASDKQAAYGQLRSTVTKIFRIENVLVGICGELNYALELVQWLRSGAKPKNIPHFQLTEDAQTMMVIQDRKIWIYAQGSVPFRHEDEYASIGSGSECATAAMWCGKSAVESVQCAIALNTGCGMGIDVLMDHEMATESLPWA